MRVLRYLLTASLLFMMSSCGSNGQTKGPLLELPALTGKETLIAHTGFIISYNTKAHIPEWVAYELTSEEASGEVPRSGNFGMDPKYHGKQAMREDYSGSGWDKGHMAPAADMKWSEESMHDSFYLTNICPQNHTLNEKDWHSLEKKVRDWAKRFGSVYIVCGPIIGENTYGSLGHNKVLIPDAFFKAVLVPYQGSYRSMAFVMQNNEEHHTLKEYSMTVNELEKLIGANLFTALDDSVEESIEDGLDHHFFGIR